ncbi:MAG: homoserine dehydrogenase [Thermomicrobiales bacterium]|nr:homoserine dehydrogenase [Thermomicrobiales bacterium]
MSVSEFLERVGELDAEWARRAEAARASGATLKYVATVPAAGPIAVGVREVSASSLLGALQGPENVVVIRTTRYDANPLTIVGPSVRRIDKEDAAPGATLPQGFDVGLVQARPEGPEPIHVGELDGGEHRRLQVPFDDLDRVADEDVVPAVLGDEGVNVFDVATHDLEIEELLDDPHDVGRHVGPPFRADDYLATARNRRTIPPGKRVSKSRTSTHVGRIAILTV